MGPGYGNDWGKGCGWLIAIVSPLLMIIGYFAVKGFLWLINHIHIN